MEDRQWFVLYVLVCLEVGFFLILVPWSAIWERNYFLEVFPDLRPVLLSPSLRGAVCGLGLANVFLGVNEILNRLRGGSEQRTALTPKQNELGELGSHPSSTDRDVSGKALAAPEER
jgi:hypothetical protein